MYTEKLKEIMGAVALFNDIYQSPGANGINFKTGKFKGYLYASSIEQFKSFYINDSVDAYNLYQSVSKKACEFEDALKEFVAQENFLATWKGMTEKEKDFLVYFDENSYGILRSKLPKEEIIKIDWNEVLDHIDVKWNEKFSKALGLSEEFATPPQNKLQAVKQSKILLTLGYTDDEVGSFNNAVIGGTDMLAKKLLELVCKKKTSDEVQSIVDGLGGNFPYWHRYTMNFIEEQEEKLKGGKKVKP